MHPLFLRNRGRPARRAGGVPADTAVLLASGAGVASVVLLLAECPSVAAVVGVGGRRGPRWCSPPSCCFASTGSGPRLCCSTASPPSVLGGVDAGDASPVYAGAVVLPCSCCRPCGLFLLNGAPFRTVADDHRLRRRHCRHVSVREHARPAVGLLPERRSCARASVPGVTAVFVLLASLARRALPDPSIIASWISWPATRLACAGHYGPRVNSIMATGGSARMPAADHRRLVNYFPPSADESRNSRHTQPLRTIPGASATRRRRPRCPLWKRHPRRLRPVAPGGGARTGIHLAQRERRRAGQRCSPTTLCPSIWPRAALVAYDRVLSPSPSRKGSCDYAVARKTTWSSARSVPLGGSASFTRRT